jgi:integrase
MGRVRVRYLVARPRKSGPAWYWLPTPTLQAAGFIARRLPDDTAAAVAAAEKLNAELDAWYQDGTPRTGHVEGSLAALDAIFQKHRTFTGLAPRTQDDFARNIRPAIKWAGDVRLDHIERRAILAWIEDQIATRGEANARNAGAALRRLFAFGRNQGWIEVTPADKLNLPTPARRARVWTVHERDRFIAAAAEVGHPSMGLAAMLGWCLGQRPADLRTLTWAAYDGSAVALRQGKTGARVWIPALPELRRLLDAADRSGLQIVVSEETKRPYLESAFQHEFARIRAHAGLPSDLQFRDFRRTLATALGAAGCSEDQIRSITGHKTREILTTYVVPDTGFARGAMKRLQDASRAQSRTDARRSTKTS